MSLARKLPKNKALHLEYLQAALRHARYVYKEDDTYYGEILECNGVSATAPTRKACRKKLREVLEEWMLSRVD